MKSLTFSSVVRRGRLLLRDSSMVHHLGSQHEAKGEDHRCLRSQPWNLVSLETLTSLDQNLTWRLECWSMWHRSHCSPVRPECI